jgi:DNA-binding MarR family transcriptional regulator
VAEEWQVDDVEERERARVRAAELSWALREVQRAGADVDRELAHRLGLRLTDYAAMGHLFTAEAPMGPVELSARLGISTGSGTELVDRLERAGHIDRQRHPDDRRRVVLQPSAAAVARILEGLRPLFTQLDQLAEEFPPAEQDAIGRYLRSAARLLKAYAADPPDFR